MSDTLTTPAVNGHVCHFCGAAGPLTTGEADPVGEPRCAICVQHGRTDALAMTRAETKGDDDSAQRVAEVRDVYDALLSDLARRATHARLARCVRRIGHVPTPTLTALHGAPDTFTISVPDGWHLEGDDVGTYRVVRDDELSPSFDQVQAFGAYMASCVRNAGQTGTFEGVEVARLVIEDGGPGSYPVGTFFVRTTWDAGTVTEHVAWAPDGRCIESSTI